MNNQTENFLRPSSRFFISSSITFIFLFVNTVYAFSQTCDPIIFQTPSTYSICSGESPAIILETNQDNPNMTFIWGINDTNETGASVCLSNCGNVIDQVLANSTSNPIIVTYVVFAQPNDGCPDEIFEIEVEINAPFTVWDNNYMPVCEGDCFNPIYNVSGGTPPYTYLWSTGEDIAYPVFCNIYQQMDLVVTITDSKGCATVAYNPVYPSYSYGMIRVSPDPFNQTGCVGLLPYELTAFIEDEITNSDYDPDAFDYYWSTPMGQLNTHTITATQEGEYSLFVTSNYTGCFTPINPVLVVNQIVQEISIECVNTTSTQVKIEWDAGPFFERYEIQYGIDGVYSFPYTTLNKSFARYNLTPGVCVDLVVTPIDDDGVCNFNFASITCCTDCQENITITNSIEEGFHRADQMISSSGLLVAGNEAKFRAGEIISFETGTNIEEGAILDAKIEDCGESGNNN